MKFKWTYVDTRGKRYLRSKSYFSFGTSLHRVLERFHDSADIGVTTTDEVASALEESWIDAGFSSAEEMAEAFGEGKDILERYVAEVRQRPTEARTLFLEKQLRHDMGDFVLLGRMDRIDEYPDGTLEVVDYKSGRVAVEPDEVETDVAMSIYQLLVKRKFPDRAVKATIVALRSGVTATASLDSVRLAEVEEDVKRLGDEILNRDYPEMTPVYKPLCKTCDFLPICRQHPDFEEVLD